MAPTIGAGTPGEAAATVLTSGREGLFPRSEQMSIKSYKGYTDYQSKTDREIPVVFLERA